MTNERMMLLLNNGERTGINEVLNYLQSIGISGLNNEENGLNEILEKAKEINEYQGRYLMDVNLFKSFTSNHSRITPTVSSTWKLDYRNADVYSGYMVLKNEEGTIIQRVPYATFLDIMKNGLINEEGELEELKINGNKLDGSFIVNHHRRLFSEGFYNLWKKIHFPEIVEDNENEVNKDNLEVGKYYLSNRDSNGVYLEKFLGFKYLVKYKIVDGVMVSNITRQKLALQLYLSNYTLSQNMSERTHGRIKNLSLYKKLKYYEEFNNLPFLRAMSEEEEYKKILNHYAYHDGIVDILDVLPAPKKEIGFKLVPAEYDDIINVIVVRGKRLLANNIVRISGSNNSTYSYQVRPKGIIYPDRIIIGKIKFHRMQTDQEYNDNGFDRSMFTVNTDLSNAYKLRVTPFINNGIQLNVIDDIIG
jgi:hypothetical protein